MLVLVPESCVRGPATGGIGGGGGEYLGCCVSCFWKSERRWFEDTLMGRDGAGRGYRVQYNRHSDGDVGGRVDFDLPDDSARMLPLFV